MKDKIYRYLGMFFIVCGLLFLLVHSFILTKKPTESFSRDLLGLPIPQAPLWISYIPYIGFFIGIIFEFLSLHGLVGLIISGVLFYIGGLFAGRHK